MTYNHDLHRLLGIPKYNSSSEMFVCLNIPSFNELLRKYVAYILLEMFRDVTIGTLGGKNKIKFCTACSRGYSVSHFDAKIGV